MGGTISTLVDKFCDNDNDSSCYRQKKVSSLKKTHKTSKKSNIYDLTEKNLHKNKNKYKDKKYKDKTYLTTDDIEEMNSLKLFDAKDEYFMSYLDKQRKYNDTNTNNTDTEKNNDNNVNNNRINQFTFPMKNDNPTGETIDFEITTGDITLSVLITPTGEVITNVTNNSDNVTI